MVFPAQVTPARGPDNSARSALPTPPPPLLLTRPRAGSERFAAEWRDIHGPAARIVIAPVQEIRPVPFPEDPADYGALIFTSANGVKLEWQKGRPDRALCVGDRTAEAASAAGFQATSAGGTAEDLVQAVLASGESGPFLHLRGREARGNVAGRLRAAGLSCDEAVVYEQRAMPLSEAAKAVLAQSQPVLVPVFSPKSATRLAAALRSATVSAPLLVAAISPAAADAWNGPAPRRVVVADRPDSTAMLAALQALSADSESP